VRLNGWKWNPQQRPTLTAGTNSWLLNPGLDLSGAVLHKLRGRGSVDLGRDTNGLVIRFDDPENGADTYEAEVLFAQTLARSKSADTNDLDLRISARIAGMDEIWFTRDQAKWTHTERGAPTDVTANGRPWDIVKHPTLPPQACPPARSAGLAARHADRVAGPRHCTPRIPAATALPRLRGLSPRGCAP
jgi:hypothetical protein